VHKCEAPSAARPVGQSICHNGLISVVVVVVVVVCVVRCDTGTLQYLGFLVDIGFSLDQKRHNICLIICACFVQCRFSFLTSQIQSISCDLSLSLSPSFSLYVNIPNQLR
jgi:hypothetical protein